MSDALAAALAGQAILVMARDAGAVAEARAAARNADVIVILIDESVPKLDAAMVIAALGPLAVDCAPNTRVSALDVAANADQADVLAAAQFLASGASTTGQVLRVTPR